MNLQKDLIQHIAVLSEAPDHLNFSQPRSSEILHVGLEETRQLLYDCLGIMAVGNRSGSRDVFRTAEALPALAPYARVFREATERIDGLMGQFWNNEQDARLALKPVVTGVRGFLHEENWYDMGCARLIQSAEGSFYSDHSPARVNFVPNWRCASLFFSQDTADCVRQSLEQWGHQNAETVLLMSLAPPQDYLWMARTYAPQTPQNLINYWEAMLPGARKLRIRQMVGRYQNA